MDIDKRTVKKFHRKIFTWWKKYKRDLPWRHTHDPYRILVSEVMLQQTQVARVLPKYAEFIRIYPTLNHLTKATPADVLRVWRGMGYNRRALYLTQAAHYIVNTYDGVFPKSEKKLTELPGVGTYTARALLVFAYKQNVSLVDTNIRHIITYFFFDDVKQKESVILRAAEQLVPKGKSWEWHQALMDYGALELKNHIPVGKKSPSVGLEKSVSTPFLKTNRYLRGRIIDVLREGKWEEQVFVSEIKKKTSRTDRQIEEVINALVKEGLLVRTKGAVMLPE